MVRNTFVAIVMLMITAGTCITVSGCGKSQPTEAGAGQVTPSGETKGTAKSGGFDEPTARDKLKIVMDSWVFGDDEKKFKGDHPDIDLIPSAFLVIDGSYDIPALQKYEIGQGRPDKSATEKWPGFEFPVLLVLQGPGGSEIKQTHIYSVRSHDNTKWMVMRQPFH